MKNSVCRVVFKTIAILAGSAIVSFALLVNVDTYSWFTSEAMHEIKVSAATTKDIIKNIEIEKDNKGNAIGIKLMKADGVTYAPTIYFSVEGEAADYVLHINPVKLTDTGEYIIPIEPNINTIQFANLLWPWHKDITGTIRIKYLNEFINEGETISFSPSYLRQKFWEEIDRGEVTVEKISDVEALNEATELITIVTDSFEWEEESSTMSLLNIDSDSIYESNLVESSLEIEGSEGTVLEQYKVLPSMFLQLTPQQSQIISSISFKLLPHMEKLYNSINNLVAILNDKLAEIARLNIKVEDLERKVEEQKIKIDEQTMKIEELESKNQELNLKTEELEKENFQLNTDIEGLLREIEELNSRNSSLSSENTGLANENLRLFAEIELLRKQIDELMSRENGGTTNPIEGAEKIEKPQAPEEVEIPAKPDGVVEP